MKIWKDGKNVTVFSKWTSVSSEYIRNDQKNEKFPQKVYIVFPPKSVHFPISVRTEIGGECTINIFNKATSLSPTVILKLTEDVPMVVEFQISEIGLLKFFLAPKINCEKNSKWFVPTGKTMEASRICNSLPPCPKNLIVHKF